jgi:NAD(P)-dependent dehydrogenase (short-subunit alcohol dehydrogenase family)
MMRLAGKIACVSGAASRPGIGSAIAELFAGEGAHVYLVDLDLDATQAVAADIRASGNRASALKVDVRVEADWAAAIAEIGAAEGCLDIMVNNAGIARHSPIAEQTPQVFDQTLDVNLRGVYLGMQAATRLMRAGQRGGSIINISSSAAERGMPGTLSYSAAKAGVVGMSRTAAVELGPERIRVNTILPGNVLTNLIKGFIDAHPPAADALIAMNPMQALLDPVDIAYGALYLASDESRFVTGSSLVIDAGQLAWSH